MQGTCFHPASRHSSLEAHRLPHRGLEVVAGKGRAAHSRTYLWGGHMLHVDIFVGALGVRQEVSIKDVPAGR